jgi:PST family polysaccharide transporter
MGTYTLGIYAFAYSLANLPATLFVRALNTVLFPSYSSLGEDREQQRSLFLRATSFMFAAGLLYTTGAVFFGRYFLLAVYGQKWIEAAAPLAILAFFALFRSLSALVGDLLVATGNPNKFRAITGLQLVLAAGGLYFGATLGGIVGVALVMTAAQAIALVAGWISAARIVGARAGEFARAVRGPIAAGVVASVGSVLAMRVLPHEGNLPALLAAAAGVVVLFLAVWIVLDAKLRSDLARAIRRGEAT